ncbi:hypothetical protein DFQ27_006889 [Actinomortierella ambigua]|uniref:Myb-like domain-containing protein n=1 Tax=Actinomortierella ambigua TaxID=1343610 RepID=A0A9P6QH11_9FUNG|nr:hypothetical protein DFQ27_006889 [Actinomortierella ambigua]
MTHKKRPSWTSSLNTDDSSLTLGSADARPQQQPQHLTSKRRSISKRPWTNAEQEALYIAVEKYKLFGQWQDVKQRMALDRTVHEIEDEYMRIYGELPDSEDGDEESLCSPTTTITRQGGEAYSHQQQQHYSRAPSSASSPSSARSSFSLASTPGGCGVSSAMSLMARHEQMFPPIQYESIFEQDEEDEDDHAAGGEMDLDYKSGGPSPARLNHNDGGVAATLSVRQQNPHQHSHRGSISSSPTRMRRLSTHLPTHTKSASSLSGIGDQHPHPHNHHRTASESHSSSRPTRMVRVWTPEQSERLKNLIELYFPGAYRINWVWVAEQMGNSFTRKQCKNKWEIMRRRMGTEEEIVLLKKGYEEFGPSWGEIQEKYLPERSRGGIEIMWELLESREAGQNQPPPPPPQLLPTVTQLKQSALPVEDQQHLVQQSPNHGRQSSTATSVAAVGAGTTTTAPSSRKQRASGLSIATTSISQHLPPAQGSSPPPSSSSKGHPPHHNTNNHNNNFSNTTPLTSLPAGGLATSDIEAMEISSPPLSLVSPHASISAPVSSSTTTTTTTTAAATAATTVAAHDRDGDRERDGQDTWRRRGDLEEPFIGGDGGDGDDEVYRSSAWRQHERTATGSSSIGMSIDSSGSGSGSPLMHHHHHHLHHHHHQQQHESIPEESAYYDQDPVAVGMALNTSNNGHGSADRSAPMIWTEPLTRRLEQAIQEHFPNGEKVNWAKISTLMGNHPVVSRDQCKRRWYLISQNQFYQRRHHEIQTAAMAAAGGADAGAASRQQQGLQAQRVAGGGAGSPPSMAMMMEMETTEREMQQQQQQQQQQAMRPYYGQQVQYPHHEHQHQHHHSHPPQQNSPHDGWSE